MLGWQAQSYKVGMRNQRHAGPITIHSCCDAAHPKRVLTLGHNPERGDTEAPLRVTCCCGAPEEIALSGHSPERGGTGAAAGVAPVCILPSTGLLAQAVVVQGCMHMQD